MTRGAVTVIVFVLAALLFGAVVLYSGVYNVAADEKHWGATAQLMQTARIRSVERRARDINPPILDDPKRVLKGAGEYAQMCVMCHLAPGVTETALRQGLYPVPPQLAERKIDPKSAFWVIKHGITISGMPAWGATHDDETLWSIVAFVQKLPSLSAQQYGDIVEKAPPHEEMSGEAVPKRARRGAPRRYAFT
jgi:mono/diheme cytochrome c family protein